MRSFSLILPAMAVAGCLIGQAQTPTINSVVNNATPGAATTTAVAPGELVNINGANLGDTTQVGCGSPTGFTTSCGGVTVTIGGKSAGVRSESAANVIIQVPVDVALGSQPLVLTRTPSGGQPVSSAPFTLSVGATAPAMYQTNFNGVTVANCFDAQNNAISPANPVNPGFTIRCIGSGFGVTNPVVPTGQVQPQSPLPAVVAAVKVTVGSQSATVNSATLAQGTIVGQYQVILVVPTGTPGGSATMTVNVGGINTPGVSLPIAFVGPNVTSVVNSASNAVNGLPNAGVAPGSILVAYGKSLGPAALTIAPGYPWPDTLSGTSVQIAVNGTNTKLLLYYTSANQIAGLLPSGTPTGNGTITVTYNGQTGSPSPITVSQNNFGVYTVSQNGTGPGIVTYADYSLVSQTKAANPGETLIIWGTGLGPVTGDEASGPLPGDMPNLPVQVWVGGVSATVVYRGRSGCCVGEDQIAFVVPNVSGCLVPLAIQIGNRVSNYSSMAVTAKGRACTPATVVVPDPFTAIPNPKILFMEISRNINPPPQSPSDQPSSDDATIRPYKIGATGADLNVLFDGPSYGSCYVAVNNNSNPQPPIIGILDAGATLTLKNPSGTTRTLTKSGTDYQAHLGDTSPGNFLDPGTYSLSGTGGADVGAFTAAFSIPQFTWTNKPAANNVPNVNRAQGVTINWTGGDPTGQVQIGGGSGGQFGSIQFQCTAHAADGTFTVPPSVLLTLPAGFGGVGVTFQAATSPITAPGIDFGGISYSSGTFVNVNFQ